MRRAFSPMSAKAGLAVEPPNFEPLVGLSTTMAMARRGASAGTTPMNEPMRSVAGVAAALDVLPRGSGLSSHGIAIDRRTRPRAAGLGDRDHHLEGLFRPQVVETTRRSSLGSKIRMATPDGSRSRTRDGAPSSRPHWPAWRRRGELERRRIDAVAVGGRRQLDGLDGLGALHATARLSGDNPQRATKPKSFRYPSVRSAPRSNASLAAPMLDDTLMTSETVMIFSGCSSEMVFRPIRSVRSRSR